MSRKILIIEKDKKLFTLLLQNNKMQYLQVSEPDESILGNIYKAKIHKVLPGLQAAFLKVEPGNSCFLSTASCNWVKAGDEIPVQVVKEAAKSKLPTVTNELSLTGKYCVISQQKPGLSFSGKLSAGVKWKLKEALERKQPIVDAAKQVNVIVRTVASELTDISLLEEEILRLSQELTELLAIVPHRTCYSLLRKEVDDYLKAVRDIPQWEYDEIITDIPHIYESLVSAYKEKIRLYQDPFPLLKLYSVETHLHNALSQKVWLDLGGFLVIEPTEALVVIDVNTGKFDNKKHSFLKINMQAAEEIARQIRIRNLSGIIIADFISMESAEENKLLMEYLAELLKKDTVKASVIDMTPLGLVEITRKKTSRPLADHWHIKKA